VAHTSYVAASPGELTLFAGDVVMITADMNKVWFWGRKVNDVQERRVPKVRQLLLFWGHLSL